MGTATSRSGDDCDRSEVGPRGLGNTRAQQRSQGLSKGSWARSKVIGQNTCHTGAQRRLHGLCGGSQADHTSQPPPSASRRAQLMSVGEEEIEAKLARRLLSGRFRHHRLEESAHCPDDAPVCHHSKHHAEISKAFDSPHDPRGSPDPPSDPRSTGAIAQYSCLNGASRRLYHCATRLHDVP